jgi:hypothetical protein
MDDFIILSRDKSALHLYMGAIEAFLGSTLRLMLNPKTHIGQAKNGIEFIGWRLWPGFRMPRKSSLIRARQLFQRRLASYRSGMLQAASLRSCAMSLHGLYRHSSINIDFYKSYARRTKDIG